MKTTPLSLEDRQRQDPQKTFAIVLSGGGARGFSHAGVLWGLEQIGYAPSAIVGVSMGAVVGVTYALRADWYSAIRNLQTDGLPGPLRDGSSEDRRIRVRLRKLMSRVRLVGDVAFDWGPGVHALDAGWSLLRGLTLGKRLEDSRIPVVTAATDLREGKRHVLREGPADEAIYASSALAAILPPLQRGKMLLADGAYADVAPIDVARTFHTDVVIAVDPGQMVGPVTVSNGYQSLVRAVEICHFQHAHARFSKADMVIRPNFPRVVDTLDFGARRMCMATGIQAVRNRRKDLEALLGSA